MIFYKASLLYIAAGLCRITQINLCIHHGHNAHTIFYLHHCLHSHSGRPYPRCPYLPLSLFVLWKINDYFYQASRLLTVCIYGNRCPQWTPVTVCIYCYRCPQWTSDEKLAARNVNNEVQFYENNNFGQYKLCPVYTGTPPRALFVNLELTFF